MANLLNPANLSPSRNSLNSGNFSTPEKIKKNGQPKGFYAAFFFEALSVATAFGVGYEYFGYLTHTGSFRLVLVLSALFLVAHVISFLLIATTTRRLIVMVFETVGLMFFFAGFPELKLAYYLGIAFAILLFFYLGERESRGRMDNGIKFKFRNVTQPLITKMVSALVLLGVLLSLPQLQTDPNFLSSQNFTDIPGWTSKFIHKFFPDYPTDVTAYEATRNLIEKQFAGDPVFQSLSSEEKELAIDRAATDALKELSRRTSSTVNSSTTLSAAFSQFTNSTLQEWYEKSPSAFLFVWAVILFFVFRGFGAIVGVGIAFLAFLVYELLNAMNIIHLTGESRIHEVIEYS